MHYLFSRKTMVFYHLSLNRFVSGYEPPQDGLVIKELTPETCDVLGEVLGMQGRRETVFQPTYGVGGVRERLGQGERCFVCQESGKILGYLWFCPKEKYIPEISAKLILQPGEVYTYNGYVVPESRGKDIAQRLNRVGFSEFSRMGFERVIMARMSWNQAIERVLTKKLDTEVIGSVSVCFLLTFCYTVRNCPGLSFVGAPSLFEFYRKLLGQAVSGLNRDR